MVDVVFKCLKVLHGLGQVQESVRCLDEALLEEVGGLQQDIPSVEPETEQQPTSKCCCARVGGKRDQTRVRSCWFVPAWVVQCNGRVLTVRCFAGTCGRMCSVMRITHHTAVGEPHRARMTALPDRQLIQEATGTSHHHHHQERYTPRTGIDTLFWQYVLAFLEWG